MQIQENILLAPFTTFKIGGFADYFARIKKIEDLKEAVLFAEKKNLKIFVLGGGSNLLISDEGLRALVLKIEIDGIEIRISHLDATRPSDLEVGLPNEVWVEIVAGAGVLLDDLIQKTVEQGFFGMEKMSWIPGTVGASAVQNCGAFGMEASYVISWVEVFDIEKKEIFILKKEDCDFVYRSSVFKRKKNWVVIRVAYLLQKCDPAVLKNKREEIVNRRKEGSPLLEGFGSAGSYFKNPIISESKLLDLQKKFQDFPYFKEGEAFKISIAWFLEKFGWKGFSEGEVGVYSKHSLFLINKGKGKSEDIKKLAEKIKKDVFDRTGLELKEEVDLVE